MSNETNTLTKDTSIKKKDVHLKSITIDDEILSLIHI